MRVDELDTPVLIVELDALEDNIRRLQEYLDRSGIHNRPHIKTHKTPAIAHLQLRAGAIGVTCQKLGEAEVMAAAGIQDILVPYNLLGAPKLERLVRLTRQAHVTVAVDSTVTAQGISTAAHAPGAVVDVVVELDTGGRRCGVQSPRACLELAQIIDTLPGLRFQGVMTFPSSPAINDYLRETLDLLDRAGLPHPIVSGGSTPTAYQAHEVYGLREHRAGEYCVGGAGHLLAGRHTVAQCALRVLTTVVSRPAPERAILDAGSKTLSASAMQMPQGPSLGYIVEYPDAHFYTASEEHGHVDVSACARAPAIGERVTVLPVHPCPCVNEHDELVAVRRGEVEAIWPILARGKVR